MSRRMQILIGYHPARALPEASQPVEADLNLKIVCHAA